VNSNKAARAAGSSPERFLRVRQIVGDPKAVPPLPPIIPVSRSCWWQWVAEGKAPKPVKLHGVTLWRASDIARFAEQAR